MTEYTDEELNNEDVEAEEEVNEEFEVVVPKDELIVMDQRPEPAFDAHVLSFTSFYIKQFKTDNLEVLEDFDVDGAMMELNRYILNNVNFTRKTLAQKTLLTYEGLVNKLMSNIEANSDIDTTGFTSFQQWSEWHTAMRAKGREALS